MTIKKFVNKIIQGNNLEILKNIPDSSVDMCFTSPPYWNLRDYGDENTIVWDGDINCNHIWGEDNFCNKCGAWKGQLGLEPTIELYIKHLCDIFDGVYRALKPEGTCWVNLGNTYMNNSSYSKRGRQGFNSKGGMIYKKSGNINRKSLCLIPDRFAIEMVNRGWILRNEIIWNKPNCMPSSASDRFTVDFEKIYFFTKQQKYYFEQQFEPYTKPLNRWGGDSLKADGESTWDAGTGQATYRQRDMRPNADGRNMRTTWHVNTNPFPGSHFAVFPSTLVEPAVKAGCPKYICTNCNVAHELVIEREKVGASINRGGHIVGDGKVRGNVYPIPNKSGKKTIKGYEPMCNCNAGTKPGIVLDPFIGSGTTAVVARNLGCSYIGIEMNPKYIEIAEKRIEDEARTLSLFD